MNTSIDKAIDILGSQIALAQAIDRHPSFVSQLRSGHRPVPLELCTVIEKATGGKVTRKELRPDDWQKIWPELIGKKAA